MANLPQELVHHFLVATLPARSPAYFFVTANNQVSRWGGDIDLYGLDLSSGHALQIDFLAGIFPLRQQETLLLPCVETAPGVFADVHIFPVAEGNWVLLLDATEDERRRRTLQQQVNGLSLLHAKLGANGEATAIAEIVSVLDVLLLERKSQALFDVIGIPPPWFFRLYASLPENSRCLCPEELSAFLANFLIDAEGLWHSQTSGRLRSGLWTEASPSGEDYHLEASALHVNGRQVLLIERQLSLFGDAHAILQKARENNLNLQHVVQETQKKEILLHCIIHDLVQPLTGMKGCLTLLQEEPLSVKGKRLVELGEQQARKQEELIHDILHVFAAEVSGLNGSRETPTEAPDLGLRIRAMVEAYAPAFASAQVQIVSDPHVNWATAWQVVGERSRLDRVLANLLENALRYSPRSSTVTVGLHDEGDMILTTVDDEGPGIPDALHKQLFQKFVRGKEHSGKVGLGLYFCRITIEGWGGEIGFSPRDTGGTRFWFRLPRPTKSDELR